jgi:hypothetical protein
VADEVPAAVSDRAAGLRRLEDSRAQATAQQSSLEAQLAGHASVIQQLKAAGATDRLQKELAASQQLAQTLDVLAGHIRELDVQLGAQRRALVDAIDRELARGDDALTADARTSLGALRAETAAKLSQGAAKIVIRAPKMGKLDDPSDLLEKAALLRDSEQKLRRQATLLAKRADGMDKRQKLRKAQERASDDLFADDSPRRRAAATVKTGGAADAARTPTVGGETKTNDPGFQGSPQPPGVAAPAPGATGTVDTTPQSATNGGGNLGALKTATDIATIDPSSGDPLVVLKDVLDPATLSELRVAQAGGDPARTIKALRRAKLSLEQLADALAKQQADMRRRASELRQSPQSPKK